MSAQVLQEPTAPDGCRQVAELQAGERRSDFVERPLQARAHVEVRVEYAAGPAAALFRPCRQAEGHLGLSHARRPVEQDDGVGLDEFLQFQYLAAAAEQTVRTAARQLARHWFGSRGLHARNYRLRFLHLDAHVFIQGGAVCLRAGPVPGNQRPGGRRTVGVLHQRPPGRCNRFHRAGSARHCSEECV